MGLPEWYLSQSKNTSLSLTPICYNFRSLGYQSNQPELLGCVKRIPQPNPTRTMDTPNLDCYKWYPSQTSGDVPAKTLDPKGVDCEVPHQLERRKTLDPKGVDCEVPHQLERRKKHFL